MDTQSMAFPTEVLIVEDSSGDYALMLRAFTSQDRPVRLVRAETVEAARSCIQASLPSIVILDVELPDGTGLSLLEQDHLGSIVPVVVMTSHGDEETAALAMKLGATDYVPKSAAAFARMPALACEIVSRWRALEEERSAQREAALREAALNQALLDTAEAAILVLDPDLRILRMNHFCESLAGLTSAEAAGRSVLSFCDDTGADWLALAASGPRSDFESWWRDGSGGRRLLSWSNTVVSDDQGSPDCIVCVALDITKARRAEDEAKHEQARLQAHIQRAQRLESVGMLAGGIAHDFNNALSAIIGFTELALNKIQADEHIRKYLEHTMAAADRSADLVRQILTFCRQGEQDPRPILLGPIASEALKFLRASIPSTIEIRDITAQDCGPVIADPTQMHQVLMNLCTNAAHAMRETGGILEVCLERVEIDASQALRLTHQQVGPHVCLTVRDTRCGISSEILDRIFDPFFTTKSEGEGTGLGLATAYGIVRSHGGTLTVHSEVGVGTEFRAYIPSACSESAAESVPELASAEGGAERILLVDDEEVLVQLNYETLSSLGYTVTSLTDSREALDVFAADPTAFDIIMTDHTMPHMTGLQLARSIRGIRPGIPIILCSGYTSGAGPDAIANADVTKFLRKPCDAHSVAAAVRQALSQQA